MTSLALRNGTIAAGIRPIGGRGAVARVLVWDAAGGGTPVQFDTDHRDVAAVGLLGPSADLVVVAGVDDTRASATLQVWEAETRRRLGRALGGLAGDVVMLGGDTSAVVGVDSGGRAFAWSLDTDPTAEICAIVGRPLSTGGVDLDRRRRARLPAVFRCLRVGRCDPLAGVSRTDDRWRCAR